MRNKPKLNRNIALATMYLPIRQGLVIRSLLEYYLLLIVVTLFLLNELFNILSCVSVWAPLFALMILFNLLSSWSWDWTLPLLQLWLAYCNTCTLIFLSLKLESGMKKHVRNVFEIKYGFVKLVVIFFLLFTKYYYAILSW